MTDLIKGLQISVIVPMPWVLVYGLRARLNILTFRSSVFFLLEIEYDR